MTTKEKIQQILSSNFLIEQLKIEDQSHLHQGHWEAQKQGGGHFSVFIVSRNFEGRNPIERHRMINAVLKELLKNQIHALAIKAFTPKELNK